MSAGREELHRILKAVIADLERDGFAVEQIASDMVVLGIHILFGDETIEALRALNRAQKVLLDRQDEEWLQ